MLRVIKGDQAEKLEQIGPRHDWKTSWDDMFDAAARNVTVLAEGYACAAPDVVATESTRLHRDEKEKKKADAASKV